MPHRPVVRAGVDLREDLRQRLWPDGTFVDFDRGLNTAVNRLRETLGDPAGNPKFIETVPRRGYRFIAAVEDLRSASADGPPAKAVNRTNGRSIRSPAAIAALSGMVALAGTVWYLAKPGRSPETAMRTFQLTSYEGNEREPSFSPDGSQVSFSWDAGEAGKSHIYVRQVASERLLQLTSGATDDRNPIWSPDGRWIAFLRDAKGTAVDIFMIPALGGQAQRLTELRPPWGNYDTELNLPVGHLAWSPDSKWLVITDRHSSGAQIGLSLVSIETGDKRKLTFPPPEWLGDYSPAFSPDGRKLAFTRAPSPSVSEIYLLSLNTDLTPKGEPERLTKQNCWIANPVWTGDGEEIVFSCGQWGVGRRLFRTGVSKRSNPQMVASLGEDIYFLAISHSGRRLAYSHEAMDVDIWRCDVADTNRGTTAVTGGSTRAGRFLSSTREESNPQYSPDGTKIAFASSRSGNLEIWIAEADGSDAFKLTSTGAPVNGFPRWSPDGKRIAFHSRPRGLAQIFVVDATGRNLRELTPGGREAWGPSWSRDGQWIYFTSCHSGDCQICKMPARGGSAIQVTERGGEVPFEGPAGDVLWYSKEYARRESGASLWKAPISGGPETLIVESLANPSTYAVTRQGVYFIGRDRSGSGMALQFLDSNAGQIRRIAPIERTPALGLTISPDLHWLLYSEMQHRASDLMLVENFR